MDGLNVEAQNRPLQQVLCSWWGQRLGCSMSRSCFIKADRNACILPRRVLLGENSSKQVWRQGSHGKLQECRGCAAVKSLFCKFNKMLMVRACLNPLPPQSPDRHVLAVVWIFMSSLTRNIGRIPHPPTGCQSKGSPINSSRLCIQPLMMMGNAQRQVAWQRYVIPACSDSALNPFRQGAGSIFQAFLQLPA